MKENPPTVLSMTYFNLLEMTYLSFKSGRSNLLEHVCATGYFVKSFPLTKIKG